MPGRGASVAGASAHARYRRLRAEYRQERVLARIVLAGVAGAMTAGVFDWLTGLAAALAALLLHSFYLRVKPDPVTHWRRGAAAERRTGRRLSRLDPAYFHVLHDRALPIPAHANLDHLVIGLTGVYAIVSRRWPVLTRLRAVDERLWVGPRPMTRLLVTARDAARTVAERLSEDLGHRVEVHAVVAVHGARLPRTGFTFDGVTVQRAGRARRLVERQPAVLTTAQVTAIAAAAERILPPMIDVWGKTGTLRD
ncbi:nuclease-related domain-containing protein [Actinoallomurus iriomotensis]|uniref:nuclease-related domain-containing protein n=1 Tax=Actinoallomurus iriomotensis TaxID=478107 RepID=UPI0025566750|nr:nuclease-related domain-containing protein [Actinoallomurus iriomotensis]